MRFSLFSEYRGLRRELYVLFVGRVMTGLGSMVWPMFTMILNQKLGMDAGVIAVCMVFYGFAALPVSLLGGRLADRFNKKSIIVVCDLVSIAAYLYCAAVPVTIRSILVFAAACLFQSAERPSYDALVADFTAPEDRERGYSLSYLGTNLGLVLAPTLAGLLFREHLNLSFLINGAAIGISTALIFFLIRDVHREEGTAGEIEKEVDDHTPVLKLILGDRVILMFILSAAVCSTVYDMFGYLLPLEMPKVFGENGAALYGTLSSVNCIVVVLFTALLTRWCRRVQDVDKNIAGQVLIIAGYVFFTFWMDSLWLCYAAVVVFTFGEILRTLSSAPFLTRRIPASHRGRLLAADSVVCMLVPSGCRVGVGVLYDCFGIGAAWMAVLTLGAVSLVLLEIMKRFDRQDHPFLYTDRKEEQL